MNYKISELQGLLVRMKINSVDEAMKHLKKLLFELTGFEWVLNLNSSNLQFIVARFPGKQYTIPETWNLIYKLKANSDVQQAQPYFNYEESKGFSTKGFLISCDTHEQCTNGNISWHMSTINADEAFKLKNGQENKGKGIRIAHLDTGYLTHPDTFGVGRIRYRDGKNILEPVPTWDAYDSDGFAHGTTTGSLISASELTSLAPEAEVIPIRGSWYVLIPPINLIKALEYAIEKKCNVISMSLGWPAFDPSIVFAEEALAHAVTQKSIIPIVAAAQPFAMQAVTFGSFPGISSYTVCAGAININKKIWHKQVFGPQIDVCTPGESVYISNYEFINGKAMHYKYRSCGTSYSTAILAGAAATWISYRGLSKLQDTYGTNIFQVFLYELFHFGTMKTDWDSDYGWGYLNLENLLTRKGQPEPKVEDVKRFYYNYVKDNTTLNTWHQFLQIVNPLSPLIKFSVQIILNLFKSVAKGLGGIIHSFGKELLLLGATNPEFREEFKKLSEKEIGASTIDPLELETLKETLRGKVSDDMAQAIGLI